MGIHIQVLYLEGGFEMKFHLLVLCCLVITAIGKKPNKVTAGDELKIQRGTVRETILSWGPSWSVKFNLTALNSNLTLWYKYDCTITTDAGIFSKYLNIMSFSKGPGFDYRIRFPAFFLKASGDNFAYLSVSYNFNGYTNKYHDYKLTLDKEYQVEGRLEMVKRNLRQMPHMPKRRRISSSIRVTHGMKAPTQIRITNRNFRPTFAK